MSGVVGGVFADGAGTMSSITNWLITSITAILLAAASAPASEAQRRQSSPPPLEAIFTPVETRVEVNGDNTTVTFGNRTYRVEPLRNPRSPERGAQMMLQGEGAWPNFEGSGFERGRFSTYYGHSGPNAFWLLPGFGLLAVRDYADPRSGAQIIERNLIRGQDGIMEPALPGRPPFWEPHFAARSGVHANGLSADRTLFITGSLTAYRSSGMGASMVLQPLNSTVSFAWLFDDQGVIQQWSPLVDLTGNTGSVSASTNAFVYHQRSDQGHVTFATQSENGALDVHVMSPDLTTIVTHREVLRVKLRSEDPERIWTTTSSIGAIVREAATQNLDSNRTVLLAPAPEREGWYGVLEADGRITFPGDGVGLIPLTRTISSGELYPGMRAINYDVATGFIIVYQTESGLRYGWASSELSTQTGPIWRDVRLHESARLAQDAPQLTAQLLLAQFDEGYWRAHAEPEVHISASTWQTPNTFSGFVPPASSAEDAIHLAESVLIHMAREINSADAATVGSTLAYMREQRRADRQERMRRSAERRAFWNAALRAAFTGMAQAEVPATPSRTRPSDLGPDFYWEGDALIHRPSGRQVD